MDFNKDLTIPCSVTIKASVVSDVDKIVKEEQAKQPQHKKNITRSSVMSILLAEAIENRKNDK